MEGGIFARILRTVAQVLRRGLTPGPLSEKERGDISSACWQVGFCNSAVGGRFMLSGAVDGDVSNSSGMVMSFGKLMIMVG